MKKSSELVFITGAGIGHLVPTVEFAKTLIDIDDRLSVTMITITEPFSPIPPRYTELAGHGIRFIELVTPDSSPPEMKFRFSGLCEFIDYFKPHARRAIAQLVSELNADSVRLTALVVDMFATSMIDIATEHGVPSYVYYTSGAAMLGLKLHFPTLDAQISGDIKDYSGKLEVPSFKNSVPPLAVPSVMWSRDDDDYTWYLYHAKRLSETKGIIVNSFHDLEPHAIDSFKGRNPRVYPVGPVVDQNGRAHSDRAQHESSNSIMKWLDSQAESSVAFLCFGSKGTFDAAQAHEIAIGLERSGHRFLWSLRPKPPYTVEEVLPHGFVERTAERGMVCGWVPQVEVLAHVAVGCFVSHCGWNSTLESVWFGVQMVTWPMYAEQQLNALELVWDLGLAVELREYYREEDELTMADEVERAVRSVMEEGEREKVKEMREKSRRALMEGGSSFASIKNFIHDLMGD